jgi:hypothetical protein
MKVVKITKRFRNGIKDHFLVIDKDHTDDNIEYICEDWCNEDSAGANYGWTADWVHVTDPQEILDAKNKEIKSLNIQLSVLEIRKLKIMASL